MRSPLLLLLGLAWVGTALAQSPATTSAGSAPTPTTSTAAPAAPPGAPPAFSAADLEKLAMPIALHPDPLIAIILPAAVYPLEIVQAARFVRDTNNIAKVDQQPWDDKVKQLAKIPDLIAKMDADLQWTVDLGQAFLKQPLDLMNAIQDLRLKAQSAGTLKTTPQQVVTVTNAIVERMYENQVVYVTNTVVQVQPASTQVVYVPSYPTTVYVDDDDDEAAAVISFGVGMAFGAAMWGHCDYHYGGCYWGGYPPPPPYPPPYRPPPGARPPPPGSRPPGMAPPGTRPPGDRPPGTGTPGGGRPPTATTMPTQRWQPDQNRLNASSAPSASTREARGWGSGGGDRTTSNFSPGTGTAGTRPSTGATPPGTRPSSGNVSSGTRPSAGTTPAARPSAPSGGSGQSAFGGVNSGSGSRDFSNRGASSRSGGGGRGGGGRGGGRR